MNTIITIPAPVVRLLRHALLSELGAAAALITRASFEPERECHPEWFVQPLQHSDSCRELLAEIGCGEPEEPQDAVIDLDLHRVVLTAALRERLAVEYDFHASMPGKSGRREARQNIREIDGFLTANGLARATAPPRTAEHWLRHHGRALTVNAARLAALLLDAYRMRRKHEAPDDPDACWRLVPKFLRDRDELHQ